MTERTDWAALRRLKHATSSLPPIDHLYQGRCPDAVNGPDARDPDCTVCQLLDRPEAPLDHHRAQLASLGQSAGAPVVGAEGLPLDLDDLRVLEQQEARATRGPWTVEIEDGHSHGDIGSAFLCVAQGVRALDAVLSCTLRNDAKALIEQARQAVDLAAQVLRLEQEIDRLEALAENRESHIAGYVQSYNKNVKTMQSQATEIRRLAEQARLGVTLASSFLTWEMGSDAADHATDDARMATCRALARKLWHERGDVRPLDVERLVAALDDMVVVTAPSAIRDEALRVAYESGRSMYRGSAMRALVLAALFGTDATASGAQQPDRTADPPPDGVIPAERPAAPAGVSLFDQRQAELRPLRHLAYQAGQLCAALRNKQAWYEGPGKDARAMYDRIERIVKRAQDREWRRRGQLEVEERRPLRPETTTTRPEAAAADESETREWVVCNFCTGTFDPVKMRNALTGATCPHCGATYDLAELDDLEAFADGPDCASDFDEEVRP